MDLRPARAVEAEAAKCFLKMSNRIGKSGVVETSCGHLERSPNSRDPPPTLVLSDLGRLKLTLHQALV